MMATIKTFPLTSRKSPAVPKGADWRSWDGGSNTPIFGVMIPKGVYIIDLDTYKGLTTDTVDDAIGVALDWNSAELQTTLNGGRHYAFRVPESANLTNDANVGGVVGLDTRASGKGYIASGEGYEPLTLFGVLHTLENPEDLPELPSEALAFFAGGITSTAADDDLLGEIVAQPLDFTDDQITHYVDKLTAEQSADSSTWLSVMFGLYHQTGGSEFGWQLFDAFSMKAPDKYNQKENRSRWESAGRSRKANPVTFATVVDLAGGRGEVSVSGGGFFDQLLDQADEVEDREQYAAFKDRVQSLTETELGPDLRSMLASALYLSFGKGQGIGKVDIKNALKVPKRKGSVTSHDSGVSMPDWLNDWAYIEKTCEFASKSLCYQIKQEAFNAKFSRLCQDYECQASHLALVKVGIPTYVDKLFWPGAGSVLEHEGRNYLNIYRPSGPVPCDVIDAEGQAAIDLILSHVDFVLSEPRDRTILLDWMTYVYQNPGKRVNWALLLQGGYGTGKSYFSNLLRMMLGHLVTNIDTAAITGRFTGWAHGAIVGVMEEIHVSGASKYEIMGKLKPFITNDTIQIEEKGRDHRTVPNFTSYFMLTNDKNALPIDEGDRRYCVMFGRIQTQAQLYKALGGEVAATAYFDKLFYSMKTNGPAICRFFTDRKISADFKPQGRAPETAAKRVMLSLAESPELLEITGLIENNSCTIISDSIIDVTWLRKLAEGEGESLPQPRTLWHTLSKLGYEPIDTKRIKVTYPDGKNGLHYIWIDPTRQTSEQAKAAVREYHKEPEVPF